MRRSHTVVLSALLAGYPVAVAHAQALTVEEKRAIGERLAPAINYAPAITLEEGGTVFVVHVTAVPSARIRGAANDYEGLVLKATSPAGIVVQPRVDQVKLTPGPKDTEISFRYAIHVEPGTKKGGKIDLTLTLLERTGFANQVASVKLTHEVTVTAARPTTLDLSRDFRGYRVYKSLAERNATELGAQGVSGLSTKSTELPRLDRIDGARIEKIFEFDRWRRRMGVARRHLTTAATSSDPEIAALARRYLEGLDGSEEQATALIAGGAGAPLAEAAAPASTAPAAPSAPPSAPASPPPAPKPDPNEVPTLIPLERQEQKPRVEPDQFAPKTEPKTPVAAQEISGAEPLTGGSEQGFERGRKETPVPVLPRSLVLDDPNLGHGAWVRLSYANVRIPIGATAPAIFFGASTAATRDVGIELVVPTAFVSVDLERAGSIYTLGNPLLSAKYRFLLPELDGQRPVLTARARWAIPISALSTIPRTRIGAEEFTQEAHFADTYAFFLENHMVGLGANAAHRVSVLHFAAQLYFDAFVPVKRSEVDPRTAFLSSSYGVSVGLRPFAEDFLGFYLEARGTTLFAGPKRSELFTYLGARGHFAEYFEPAIWISVPVGSVSRASSFQFGAELRFTYDVEGVIVRGKSTGRGELE